MAGITFQDLQKYIDLSKIFMQKCSSIDDCLYEATQTQKHIAELIELKYKIAKQKLRDSAAYESKLNECRNIAMDVMMKKGLKFTEKMLDSKAEVAFKNDTYLREEFQESTLLEGIVQDLLFAYYQRKGILTEMISHWKARLEIDSCIMNNKKFVERMMKYA